MPPIVETAMAAPGKTNVPQLMFLEVGDGSESFFAFVLSISSRIVSLLMRAASQQRFQQLLQEEGGSIDR